MSDHELEEPEQRRVVFTKKETRVIKIETTTEIVRSETYDDPITKLVSFPLELAFAGAPTGDHESLEEEDDLEERRELCKAVGLVSVPGRDKSAFDRIDGLFDDLSIEEVDVVKWVKSLRQGNETE